jgi:hypothetical protein
MAYPITPRNLVVRALSRRKISNTPAILPPPVNQVPQEELYNFGDVGGMKPFPTSQGGPPAEMSSGPGQGSYAPQQQEIPVLQSQGGMDTPPGGAVRPRVVPDQPITGDTAPSDSPSTDVPMDSISPVEDELRGLLDERSRMLNSPVEDDDSKLHNFATGSANAIRQAARTGDLGFVVGAAIGGGLRNLFRPKEDDQRDRDKALTKNQQQIVAAEKRGEAELDRKYKKAQITKVADDSRRADQKVTDDHLKGEQGLLMDVYKQSSSFDPADPKNADIVARMQKANVPIFAKQKDDKWQVVKFENGDAKLFNPTTKEFKDIGNFAKPPTVSAKELPDELFGLKSDKQISDEASARVGKLPEGRRLRPEALQALGNIKDAEGKASYQNPDGSFNEQKYWADFSDGLTYVSPSQIYENLPSNYEQRLAGERNKLRDQQKDRQTEVAKFRTAISNYTPKSDAQPQPLTKVVDLFNGILALPPKIRQEKLKIFHANLPNIRIQ